MSDERTSIPPPPPAHFDHYCDCRGCVKWGAFGKERGHGITEWRCTEHLAADYWDGRYHPRNGATELKRTNETER